MRLRFGPDPFEDIFPWPMLRHVPVRSLGSGFLVHPDGYVVTNAHVVRRAREITVKLEEGLQVPAEVVSADARHDLAILKIDPPKGRKLAYLAPTLVNLNLASQRWPQVSFSATREH